MNIQEVARLAKVSTATVSRVLNNSPKVRPSTTAQVQRVIHQLNYVPNTSARYLRAGHTRLFGLIVSDIKNPFFPDLIDRFEELSAERGIDVVFTHTNYDPARMASCLRRMLDRNVDGIALMTSEIDPESLERVRRTKTPLVLLNQTALEGRFNNIHVDYGRGFSEAVRHLKGLGHRRIAFIAGPGSFDSTKRRRAAFVSAMKQNSLPTCGDLLAQGDLQVEGGYTATQRLLKASPRLTAIVCSNDLMAIGALQAIQKSELSVPEDISVVGFDDLPLCRITTPPLTTISLSRHQIAEQAFAALCGPVRSRGRAVFRCSISAGLVVRSSTAECRSVDRSETRDRPVKKALVAV